MKVKELVNQLQKFDQEKEIWVLYDCCHPQVPNFFEIKEDCIEIKTGDIVHTAW